MCSPVFCSMWGTLWGLPGRLWVALCLMLCPVNRSRLGLPGPSAPPQHRGCSALTPPCATPSRSAGSCGAAVETQPFVSYLSRVTLFRCLVCSVLKTAVSNVSLDVLGVLDERVKSVHARFCLQAEVLENWNLGMDYTSKNEQILLWWYDVGHSYRLHLSQQIKFI